MEAPPAVEEAAVQPLPVRMAPYDSSDSESEAVPPLPQPTLLIPPSYAGGDQRTKQLPPGWTALRHECKASSYTTYVGPGGAPKARVPGYREMARACCTPFPCKARWRKMEHHTARFPKSSFPEALSYLLLM